MLKFLWLILSFILILIIFFRIPKESAGLSNLSAKIDLLNSTNASERFLNILTFSPHMYYLCSLIFIPKYSSSKSFLTWICRKAKPALGSSNRKPACPGTPS